MAEDAADRAVDRAGDHEVVLVQRQGRVVEIILNRPERRNALTGPLALKLAETIEELNQDEEVSVLLLRGGGGAFCSGLDLKEFSRDPQPDWVSTFGQTWRRVHRALYDSSKIVVGALERAAVNGGAALALACDFLIVGDGSFLQVGEIQQGMPAPMNMAWLRLRHSEATAARVALLGDRIEGQALVDLGLAFSSVPDDAVVAEAKVLADRMAAHDPGGVRRIKTMLRRAGFADDAEQWFERATAADPLSGRPMTPIAAENR